MEPMIEIFGKEGHLQRLHDRFEFRNEQLLMAEFLYERFWEGECGMVEAGTGIGKTLAYLIPALIYCLKNNKRIAISTETKALQKQILDKDMPTAAKIIGKYHDGAFKYSLCLGSSNYPCLRRFELTAKSGKLDASHLDYLQKLQEKFAKRDVFSRFDVRIPDRVWSEIAREPDACRGYNCPHQRDCVFQRVRKSWADSQVLIMNHYLFFSNIASGKTYLPDFDLVIFDEAHSAEEIASDQLGFDVSYNGLLDNIHRFHRRGGRRKDLVDHVLSGKMKTEAVKVLGRAEKEAGLFFEELRNRLTGDRMFIRLREVLPGGIPLIETLKEFFQILESIDQGSIDDHLTFELDIARGKLFDSLQNLTYYVYQSDENFVYWLEKNETELLGDLHLRGQPVEVSEIMRREVNGYYDTAAYISATLAVNEDFSFTSGKLGLEGYKSLYLTSPFNYETQTILYIPEGGLEPDREGYVDHLASWSAEIVTLLEGNCLLLFTSYKMMRELRGRLEGLIENRLHIQGDCPVPELMDRYIREEGSILLGTHSFWQGIDLPGDLLRGVIITRLPFSVPDRPVIQAKTERLTERGLNPFSALHLPEAIIRFKQGFGRLIRSREDRGVVAVLDTRILNKGYGRMFLNSLPRCPIARRPDDLRAFLERD